MAVVAVDRVAPSPRRAGDTARPWIAVVGHDGSAAAAAALAHAARRVAPDGYLVVVHALPVWLSVGETEMARTYASVARSLLRSIDAVLRDSVSHETRIVTGPASQALLETARRYGADEIVLGAAGGRAARGAIGRVADAVLRRSERPVTIVPRPA
jgi:nucleotide-binding universal stress UspA family protein